MIRITIDTDNAAFEDRGTAIEVADILEYLAKLMRFEGVQPQTIRDTNGNSVGALETY